MRTGGQGMRLVDAGQARTYMESARCTEADFARVDLDIEEG